MNWIFLNNADSRKQKTMKKIKLKKKSTSAVLKGWSLFSADISSSYINMSMFLFVTLILSFSFFFEFLQQCKIYFFIVNNIIVSEWLLSSLKYYISIIYHCLRKWIHRWEKDTVQTIKIFWWYFSIIHILQLHYFPKKRLLNEWAVIVWLRLVYEQNNRSFLTGLPIYSNGEVF